MIWAFFVSDNIYVFLKFPKISFIFESGSILVNFGKYLFLYNFSRPLFNYYFLKNTITKEYLFLNFSNLYSDFLYLHFPGCGTHLIKDEFLGTRLWCLGSIVFLYCQSSKLFLINSMVTTSLISLSLIRDQQPGWRNFLCN